MKLKVIERQTSVNEKSKVVITIITDNIGNKFKGKARCSSEDNFDKEFGSKLSFLRAKSKMYNKYAREYNKAIKEVNNKLEIFKTNKSILDKSKQEVLDNIKGLIG